MIQTKTVSSYKSVLKYSYVNQVDFSKFHKVCTQNNNFVYQTFTLEELEEWLMFATNIEKDFERVKTENNKRINSFVEHSHRIFQGKLGEVALLKYIVSKKLISEENYKNLILKIKENYAKKNFRNIDYSDIPLYNNWTLESKTSAVMKEDGTLRDNNIVGHCSNLTPKDVYRDIKNMKLNIVCEKDHLIKILENKQSKENEIDENKFYIIQSFLPASYAYIIKYMLTLVIDKYYTGVDKESIIERVISCKRKNLVEYYLLLYFNKININSSVNERQIIVNSIVKELLMALYSFAKNEFYIEKSNKMLSDEFVQINKVYDLFIKGVLYFYKKNPHYNMIIITEGVKLVDTKNKQTNYRINGPHKVSLHLPIGSKEHKKIDEIIKEISEHIE